MSEAIRGVVSMAILTQLRDPRIENVTVTFVEVSGDMRHAKVNVSIMGDEKKQQLVLHGLKSSAGFLQSKIAERLDTRYIPKLQFVLDLGVKHSAEISQILNEVLPKDPADADDPEADAEHDTVEAAPSVEDTSASEEIDGDRPS